MSALPATSASSAAGRPFGADCLVARRARYPRRGWTLGLLGLIGIAAVLSLPLSSASAVVLSGRPAGYTGGCNGQGPGVRVFGPTGTASATSHPARYDPTTGLYGRSGHDSEWASASDSYSWVAQGLHWSIGPANGSGAAGTPAGCLDPIHSVSGVHAIYKWRLTFTAYVAANCSGDGNTSAEVDLDLIENVHFLASPWYVFTTMPSTTIFTKNVSCASYATGPVRTGLLTVSTPAMNLSSGTNYDLYTSVYTVATASAAPGATAYAAITVNHAELVRACYPRC